MFNGFLHFGGFNPMTENTTPFTGLNGYSHAFGPFSWNGALRVHNGQRVLMQGEPLLRWCEWLE
jgi:hypothetical protein